MSPYEKYIERIEGIDQRFREWVIADERRFRHAECRCWLRFEYRSDEITIDGIIWRMWSDWK